MHCFPLAASFNLLGLRRPVAADGLPLASKEEQLVDLHPRGMRDGTPSFYPEAFRNYDSSTTNDNFRAAAKRIFSLYQFQQFE